VPPARVDALADPGNTPLLAAMCGLAGAVPFECAGTPAEVRAVLGVIADRREPPAAVAGLPATCLEPQVGETLADLVGDLGPAPLLSPGERAAAARWAGGASGFVE
jgi:hypothetical protein